MHCSTLPLHPSLSPMWHKGLSYTPPPVRLCQEPSSVRLLLYRMRKILLDPVHYMICQNRKPIHSLLLLWVQQRSILYGLFQVFCWITSPADEWTDSFLIESLWADGEGSLAIYCFINRRTSCPKTDKVLLNLLVQMQFRREGRDSQHFPNVNLNCVMMLRKL